MGIPQLNTQVETIDEQEEVQSPEVRRRSVAFGLRSSVINIQSTNNMPEVAFKEDERNRDTVDTSKMFDAVENINSSVYLEDTPSET